MAKSDRDADISDDEAEGTSLHELDTIPQIRGRSVGTSAYNKYSQITARAVRASFKEEEKEEERLLAERRASTPNTVTDRAADEVAREKETSGKSSS
ncbi:hypothetical protein D9615_008742 [Tricholomella constricta]|uniref:Uncharacterized protein n=1 Tax=Tricholomella constricta TaxID=117010 RepID=A0A8H5H835_9AGAR|nr:hypothetical protein D9615_008742 [Tricholomella constricta]